MRKPLLRAAFFRLREGLSELISRSFPAQAVVQFGSRVGPGELEIPSTSLRAGSSLRLKNGSAQDDSRGVIVKLHLYPPLTKT